MTAWAIFIARGASARCSICRTAIDLTGERSVRRVVELLAQFEAAHAACGPVTAAVLT